MTKKLQKRDNRYYLERLRCDHPSIFIDYQGGKYPSAAAAFVAAGLRKQRSQLDQLQSAWAKASQSERDAFKTLIGCVAANSVNSAQVTGSGSPSGVPLPAQTTAGVGVALHIDGYLSADTVTHIKKVMIRRGMEMGDLMAALGFKKLNPSLGLAINRGSRVRDHLLLDALKVWLAKIRSSGRLSTVELRGICAEKTPKSVSNLFAEVSSHRSQNVAAPRFSPARALTQPKTAGASR